MRTWLLIAMIVASGSAMAAAADVAPTIDELLNRRTRMYNTLETYLRFERDEDAVTLTEELAQLERQLVTAALAEKPPVESRVKAFRATLTRTLEWLSKKYEQRGAMDLAIRARKEVLSLAEQRFGKSDWRYIDARLAVENLLTLKKLLQGSPDKMGDMADIAQQLAELDEQDKLPEALSKAKDLIALRKEFLGDTHPDTIAMIAELGSLHYRAGEVAEAERCTREAADRWRMALGENHPQYASSLLNLGTFYQSIGQLEEAEALYRQAADIWRQTLGEHDPRFGQIFSSLGDMNRSVSRLVEAEQDYGRAVDIFRNTLSEKHPSHMEALADQAIMLAELGKYDEAEARLSRALQLMQQHHGAEKPETIEVLFNLGEIHRQQGHSAKAEALFLQASELWKKTLGENHVQYRESLLRLSQLYKQMNEPDKARRIEEKLGAADAPQP